MSNLPNNENNLLLQVALSHLGASVATVKDSAGLEKLKGSSGAKMSAVLASAGNNHEWSGWSGWDIEPANVEEDGGRVWEELLSTVPTTQPPSEDEAALAAVFQGAKLGSGELVRLGVTILRTPS